MDLTKLSEPLRIDQIDFRVQSINKGGYATILAYKDARCDMQRLDDVCGPLGWKREHSRDNHNCTVSIFNNESGQWVGKEDTGTESNAEAQKGLASDSFKRSCFNWGIGRELYDYPPISVKLRGDGKKNEKGFPVDKDGEWVLQGNGGKPQASYALKIKEWTWGSEWKSGFMVSLTARDSKGERYKYGQDLAGHTPEQKAAFNMLIASADGWGLKKYAQDVGVDVLTSLFNSAPQGQKTSLKDNYRDAVNAANSAMKSTVVAIQEAISDTNKSAVDEIFAELEELEAEFINAALTEIEHVQIQQLQELAY